MLKKLEEAYLAILRVVVIVVATVLLVAVVWFVAASLKPVTAEKAPAKQMAPVSEQAVVNKVLGVSGPGTPGGGAPPAAAAYGRALAALSKFMKEQTGGMDSVDQENALETLKRRAEMMDNNETAAAYVAGLGPMLEKVLGSPAVIAAAKQGSPYMTASQVIDAYSEEFTAESKKVSEEAMGHESMQAMKEAERSQNLYMAAGAFAMFLSVLFLTLVIKIERNLRNLQPRA
jgi:hypothetical protein